MSLSPWDIGAVFSFELVVHQPRSSRTNRLQRDQTNYRRSSYRRAVKDPESQITEESANRGEDPPPQVAVFYDDQIHDGPHQEYVSQGQPLDEDGFSIDSCHAAFESSQHLGVDYIDSILRQLGDQTGPNNCFTAMLKQATRDENAVAIVQDFINKALNNKEDSKGTKPIQTILSNGGHSTGAQQDDETKLAQSIVSDAPICRLCQKSIQSPSDTAMSCDSCFNSIRALLSAQPEKPPDEDDALATPNRYRRSLVALCLGYILVYTGFRAVQNLLPTVLSSPDSKFNTGCFSMAALYLTMCLSCLLAPQFTARIKAKYCMLIGMSTYLLWFLIVALYPVVLLLLPVSCLVGLGQSVGWSAQLLYLSKLFHDYYQLQPDQATGRSLTRYNALFLAAFQTTHIWGNAASAIFLGGNLPEEHHVRPSTQGGNVSNVSPAKFSSVVEVRKCGKFDCRGNYSSMIYTELPNFQPLILFLMALAAVGFFVIVIFLQKIEAKTLTNSTCRESAMQQLSQIVSDRTFCLLTPLLIFNGFEQAFIYADFNKSFVACALQVHSIGLTMIAVGLTSALTSLALDIAGGRLPREVLIGVGSVVHIGLLILMLIWEPESTQPVPIYFIAVFLGMCDAVWITQANGELSVLI